MPEFVVAKTGENEAQWRQFLAQTFTQGGFMLARDGVIGGTGLGVTQTTTASASVVVDAGAAVIQDSVLGGAYPMVNPSALTLDILGANPMGGVPRNDIVVIDYATGNVRNIVGTPNAVPTDPTVPASALKLARLRHNASATSVPTANIDNLRVYTAARGGIVPVVDGPDRDSLYARAGTAVVRADTGGVEVVNFASQWRALAMVSDAKTGKRSHWGVYSGTVSGSAGAFTVTHGAGFTPTVFVPTDSSAGAGSGSYAFKIGVSALTSTTASLVGYKHDGTYLPAGTVVSVHAFMGE